MGEKTKIAAGLIALLLLYGIVGNADYVDALEQENKMLKTTACNQYMAWHMEATGGAE